MKIADILNDRRFDRIQHPAAHDLAAQAISLMKFSRTGFTSFHFSGHLYNVQIVKTYGVWFLTINGKDVNIQFDTRHQVIRNLVHLMVSDEIAQYADGYQAPAAPTTDMTPAFEVFAARYCLRQEQTPAGLREVLREKILEYSPEGFFMLECVLLDSSRAGELVILPYGPNNTFKAVPTGPVSPRGLASDMSVVVATLAASEVQ